MAFNLTRKTDYALVTLSVLAVEAASGGGLLSARRIAAEQDLPLPLLMNLLKDLNRAGIIQSQRGAAGGYRLARAPDQIGLLQVIEALEGPVHIAECCPHSRRHGAGRPASCRVGPECPILLPMQRLDQKVREFLAHLTLHELVGDMEEKVRRPVRHNLRRKK